MVIRIGIDLLERETPSKKIVKLIAKYTDILRLKQQDIDGWVDPALWLPFPYDIVWLKTETRIKPGWWTGTSWDGLRLKPEEKVLYWKYKGEAQ